MSIEQAIQVLRHAGAVVLVPGSSPRFFSLAEVAARLSVSVKWTRAHLSAFPGAFRLPGGEWRVPERDLDQIATPARVAGKKERGE